MSELGGAEAALPALMVGTSIRAEGTRLMLGGELGVAEVAELDDCVKRLVESTPPPARLVLDPTGLHFVDSIGARALLRACDRLAAVSVVEIGWLQPQVRDMLERAGAVIPDRPRPDELLEWVGPD